MLSKTGVSNSDHTGWFGPTDRPCTLHKVCLGLALPDQFCMWYAGPVQATYAACGSNETHRQHCGPDEKVVHAESDSSLIPLISGHGSEPL